jgi:hypothetical protein
VTTARFELIDTTASQLWDYGWFDESRFRVPDAAASLEWRALVGAFFSDPISQRSFCSQPDPWGASCGRHGPFSVGSIDLAWFEVVRSGQLVARLTDALKDPQFRTPPSAEQVERVLSWGAEAERPGNLVAELMPPSSGGGLKWAHAVWCVFREYLVVASDGSTLSVAVVGYD